MNNGAELQRLRAGPMPDSHPGGIGLVQLVAHCAANAAVVLERCKQTLTIVLEHSATNFPTDEEWGRLLPQWFVERCAPEPSSQERGRWLRWWKSLSPVEQARTEREKRWTSSNWIYWFEPDTREWFWWDAKILNENELRVIVQVSNFPFPWGALDWLLRGSGATDVELEKD
jgi:hypothetical protein